MNIKIRIERGTIKMTVAKVKTNEDLKNDLSMGYADKMLEIYHDVWNKWHEVKEKVDIINKKQVDLLHKIEGKNYNDKEGLKLLNEMKECRIERRRLKNELAKLSVLTNFTRETIKNVYELKNEIESLDNIQRNWKYICQTSGEEIACTDK